jgi:hypothetical protein
VRGLDKETTKRFRRLPRPGVAVWLLVALCWVLLLVAEKLTTDSLACELVPNSSIYGQADWSWLPPGKSCTWTGNVHGAEVTFTEGPDSHLLVIALGLVCTALLFVVGRVSRGRKGRDR